MVASWLWDHLLLATGLVGLLILGLVLALALGWNSPRPAGSPDWEVQAVPYRFSAAPDQPYTKLLVPGAGDFAYEVVLRPDVAGETALVEYGLIYRAQDLANHYAFLVGVDGYYTVQKVEAGRRTPLVPWQQFPHIRRGLDRNRLLVACDGPVCSFRINDEAVVTVDDDQWLSGELGIAAQSSERHAGVTMLEARAWFRDE